MCNIFQRWRARRQCQSAPARPILFRGNTCPTRTTQTNTCQQSSYKELSYPNRKQTPADSSSKSSNENSPSNADCQNMSTSATQELKRILGDAQYSEIVPMILETLDNDSQADPDKISLQRTTDAKGIAAQIEKLNTYTKTDGEPSKYFSQVLTFSLKAGSPSPSFTSSRHGRNNEGSYTAKMTTTFDSLDSDARESTTSRSKLHNLYEVHVERVNGEDRYTVGLLHPFVGGLRIDAGGQSQIVLTHGQHQFDSKPQINKTAVPEPDKHQSDPLEAKTGDPRPQEASVAGSSSIEDSNLATQPLSDPGKRLPDTLLPTGREEPNQETRHEDSDSNTGTKESALDKYSSKLPPSANSLLGDRAPSESNHQLPTNSRSLDANIPTPTINASGRYLDSGSSNQVSLSGSKDIHAQNNQVSGTNVGSSNTEQSIPAARRPDEQISQAQTNLNGRSRDSDAENLTRLPDSGDIRTNNTQLPASNLDSTALRNNNPAARQDDGAIPAPASTSQTRSQDSVNNTQELEPQSPPVETSNNQVAANSLDSSTPQNNKPATRQVDQIIEASTSNNSARNSDSDSSPQSTEPLPDNVHAQNNQVSGTNVGSSNTEQSIPAARRPDEQISQAQTNLNGPSRDSDAENLTRLPDSGDIRTNNTQLPASNLDSTALRNNNPAARQDDGAIPAPASTSQTRSQDSVNGTQELGPQSSNVETSNNQVAGNSLDSSTPQNNKPTTRQADQSIDTSTGNNSERNADSDSSPQSSEPLSDNIHAQNNQVGGTNLASSNDEYNIPAARRPDEDLSQPQTNLNGRNRDSDAENLTRLPDSGNVRTKGTQLPASNLDSTAPRINNPAARQDDGAIPAPASTSQTRSQDSVNGTQELGPQISNVETTNNHVAANSLDSSTPRRNKPATRQVDQIIEASTGNNSARNGDSDSSPQSAQSQSATTQARNNAISRNNVNPPAQLANTESGRDPDQTIDGGQSNLQARTKDTDMRNESSDNASSDITASPGSISANTAPKSIGAKSFGSPTNRGADSQLSEKLPRPANSNSRARDLPENVQNPRMQPATLASVVARQPFPGNKISLPPVPEPSYKSPLANFTYRTVPRPPYLRLDDIGAAEDGMLIVGLYGMRLSSEYNGFGFEYVPEGQLPENLIKLRDDVSFTWISHAYNLLQSASGSVGRTIYAGEEGVNFLNVNNLDQAVIDLNEAVDGHEVGKRDRYDLGELGIPKRVAEIQKAMEDQKLIASLKPEELEQLHEIVRLLSNSIPYSRFGRDVFAAKQNASRSNTDEQSIEATPTPENPTFAPAVEDLKTALSEAAEKDVTTAKTAVDQLLNKANPAELSQDDIYAIEELLSAAREEQQSEGFLEMLHRQHSAPYHERLVNIVAKRREELLTARESATKINGIEIPEKIDLSTRLPVEAEAEPILEYFKSQFESEQFEALRPEVEEIVLTFELAGEEVSNEAIAKRLLKIAPLQVKIAAAATADVESYQSMRSSAEGFLDQAKLILYSKDKQEDSLKAVAAVLRRMDILYSEGMPLSELSNEIVGEKYLEAIKVLSEEADVLREINNPLAIQRLQEIDDIARLLAESIALYKFEIARDQKQVSDAIEWRKQHPLHYLNTHPSRQKPESETGDVENPGEEIDAKTTEMENALGDQPSTFNEADMPEPSPGATSDSSNIEASDQGNSAQGNPGSETSGSDTSNKESSTQQPQITPLEENPREAMISNPKPANIDSHNNPSAKPAASPTVDSSGTTGESSEIPRKSDSNQPSNLKAAPLTQEERMRSANKNYNPYADLIPTQLPKGWNTEDQVRKLSARQIESSLNNASAMVGLTSQHAKWLSVSQLLAIPPANMQYAPREFINGLSSGQVLKGFSGAHIRGMRDNVQWFNNRMLEVIGEKQNLTQAFTRQQIQAFSSTQCAGLSVNFARNLTPQQRLWFAELPDSHRGKIRPSVWRIINPELKAPARANSSIR